ncbi:ROK family protein [Agromyces sp. SYSU K20354]|uniref:ROK family protein n=1 Tax=Agromyces cavernae TaxID=2898659 RepID=UPI001E3D3F64|nr:ROK family protein [Agromyces cavernae]MCD2443228.1 ROK family protein [Agromyces cavernae]
MRTVAIDLGGTAVKLGVFDSGRLVSVEESAAFDGQIGLDETADRVERLLAGERPDAIGIAVPGIVDPDGSRLLAAHGKYAALHDLDLSSWARDRFECPAVVENDARAALIGEITDGCAQGARDAVLVVLGTGIGAAAVLDGHVVRGRHGHAAILGGHITVDIDGPRCPCGNIGCAEALASTWALARDASTGRQELGPELARRLAAHGGIGIRDVVETRDESESAAILDRYLRIWSAVIVTQCHAFDPDIVIVTGGVLRAVEVILPALRDRVHADLWSSSFRPSFVTPEDPSTSVLRGVAELAADLDRNRISNSKGRP